MSKHWAVIALAVWLLMAVAMNTALVSQENSGPTIQTNDLAAAFN
jgi:hypothetical protein